MADDPVRAEIAEVATQPAPRAQRPRAAPERQAQGFDLALAAAKVLSSDGHANKIYELAGDEALTLPEIAGAFAQVSGKPVVYQDMPAEQYAGVLESVGVPAAFAAVLADSDTGLSKGWLENDGTDLSDLIGRPTTSFKTVLEEVL